MNASLEILRQQAVNWNNQIEELERAIARLTTDPAHNSVGSSAYKELGAARNNRNRLLVKLNKMERDCPQVLRR